MYNKHYFQEEKPEIISMTVYQEYRYWQDYYSDLELHLGNKIKYKFPNVIRSIQEKIAEIIWRFAKQYYQQSHQAINLIDFIEQDLAEIKILRERCKKNQAKYSNFYNYIWHYESALNLIKDNQIFANKLCKLVQSTCT